MKALTLKTAATMFHARKPLTVGIVLGVLGALTATGILPAETASELCKEILQ